LFVCFVYECEFECSVETANSEMSPIITIVLRGREKPNYFLK